MISGEETLATAEKTDEDEEDVISPKRKKKPKAQKLYGAGLSGFADLWNQKVAEVTLRIDSDLLKAAESEERESRSALFPQVLRIPYELYGPPMVYEPDFLVRLKNGVTVILEIKGQAREETEIKHQAARRWVSAVNNWGRLGEWDFLPCWNPQQSDGRSAFRWRSAALFANLKPIVAVSAYKPAASSASVRARNSFHCGPAGSAVVELIAQGHQSGRAAKR